MWIIQFWPIAIRFFNKSRAGVAIYFFRFCSNCMLRLKVCHFSKWEVYDSTIFGWVSHLQLCATGWLGSFWCVDMHIWYIDSWWILKEWPSGLTFFCIFMFLSCCGGFVHSSFISSEWKTLQSSRQRLSLSLSFSHSLRPSVPRLQISLHEYQVTDVTLPNNYSKKGFHTLSTICEHMISLG